MASERVLDIAVCRHVLTSERPFQVVLDGIHAGIGQPDIGMLFAKLAASTSYEEFSELVRQAQGSAGLFRFLQLDDDHVLALDPQARHQAGCRLVRLIRQPRHYGADDPPPAPAGFDAPVTILIQELPGRGTQVAYDTVASAIALYGDAAASQVAKRLDTEVLASCSTRPAYRQPQVSEPPRQALQPNQHRDCLGQGRGYARRPRPLARPAMDAGDRRLAGRTDT